MGDFAEFLANQDRIYREIDVRRQEALRDGLLPDDVLAKCRGGYFIALRPGEEVVNHLKKVTYNLRTVLPNAVVYYPGMFHTTLAVYGQADDFSPRPDTFAETVVKLGEAVRNVKWLPSLCQYQGVTFDRASVVMKGQPDESFLENAKQVKDILGGIGLEVRLPWGAHVTLARFTAVGSADVATRLDDAIRNLPDKNITNYFRSAFAGHFMSTPTSFHIRIESEVLLPK